MNSKPKPLADLVDDDDAWQALDEIEDTRGNNAGRGKGKEYRPSWLPEGIEPILEELPKWNLLSEVLQEVEEETIRQETLRQPITGKFYLF